MNFFLALTMKKTCYLDRKIKQFWCSKNCVRQNTAHKRFQLKEECLQYVLNRFYFAETYVQLDLVQLAKNNEVKTFSNWGKEFSVTFDFIAKKAQPTTPGSRTTSILHISGMAIQVIEFSSGGIQNWKDDSKFNHVLLVC